jgi:hypothetical protein
LNADCRRLLYRVAPLATCFQPEPWQTGQTVVGVLTRGVLKKL